MANEILQKSRTRIEAQGNTTALTADENPNSGSYTGDTPISLDNSIDATGDNPRGAEYLRLELNVTTPPTSEAFAQVWWRGSEDNSNWTKWKYSHSVADSIATTSDRYDSGMFLLSYKYTELAIVANDYAFNASLFATPKLMEVQ